MQKIKAELGTAIGAAAATSSIPAAFFAALVANESGGNCDAQRFEGGVFSHLSEVFDGRAPAYGSLSRISVLTYVTGSADVAGATVDALSPDNYGRLKALATSWGITQIMGYEAIALKIEGGAEALRDAVVALKNTTLMLNDFMRRFQIFATDAEELFDCWNTGRPHSPTYDPQYIPNGLARMQIYAGLA